MGLSFHSHYLPTTGGKTELWCFVPLLPEPSPEGRKLGRCWPAHQRSPGAPAVRLPSGPVLRASSWFFAGLLTADCRLPCNLYCCSLELSSQPLTGPKSRLLASPTLSYLYRTLETPLKLPIWEGVGIKICRALASVSNFCIS